MQDGVMGVGGADAAEQGKSKERQYTAVSVTPVKYVTFEAEEYKWINNSAREEIDFDAKMKFLETIGAYSTSCAFAVLGANQTLTQFYSLCEVSLVPRVVGQCQAHERQYNYTSQNDR